MAVVLEMEGIVQVFPLRGIPRVKPGDDLLQLLKRSLEESGVTLQEFTEILIRQGFVHAINMDGGGSVTQIVDGLVLSQFTDPGELDLRFRQGRNISSMFCYDEVPDNKDEAVQN